MSHLSPFALLPNASALPWGEVPEWGVSDFLRRTAGELERGARLCAWFGVPDGAGKTHLVAVIAFDSDNMLAAARSESLPAGAAYPSLTPEHPQAHLFEREVWEQHGLVPQGHPWLKPVRVSTTAALSGSPPPPPLLPACARQREVFQSAGPRNSRGGRGAGARRDH